MGATSVEEAVKALESARARLSSNATAQRVTRIYAEALYAEAEKRSAVEDVLEELELVSNEVAGRDAVIRNFFVGGLGVVFGVIQAAPNSTLEQTQLFATQVNEVYRSFPEAQSIFQIISPTAGFAGMVTKPWEQRKKNTDQLQLEAAAGLSR